MADDDMWQLVEAARAAADDPADIEAVAEALVDVLTEAGPERIRRFDVEMQTATARAYGWPLWGAAYVMNGGCGDDGFDYFLGWLVGQGRDVFERAVDDPDSLAAVVSAQDEGSFESEDLLGVAWTAYEQATGEDLPEGPPVERAELGPDWDFDDQAEMRRRYPRLTAVF